MAAAIRWVGLQVSRAASISLSGVAEPLHAFGIARGIELEPGQTDQRVGAFAESLGLSHIRRAVRRFARRLQYRLGEIAHRLYAARLVWLVAAHSFRFKITAARFNSTSSFGNNWPGIPLLPLSIVRTYQSVRRTRRLRP